MSYELQKTCNLMVQIKWCWFHSKYLYLAKLWAKMARMPIFGHTFLAITQPFWWLTEKQFMMLIFQS